MKRFLLSPVASLLFLAHGAYAEDTLQIRSIDFQAQVVELHNFNGNPQSLDGWRFCSHDENQVRVYSSSSGLNGVSVPAGASVYIHWNNDAPGGDSSRINVSSVGPVASPLDSGAFGLQIYFPPVSFGNGFAIADHLQWSIGAADNSSADERSDEAEAGGVWVNQTHWIGTTADSLKIQLTDDSGNRLHSPENYSVIEPPTGATISPTTVTVENEIQIDWPDATPAGAFEYVVESNTDVTASDGWTEEIVTETSEFTQAIGAGGKYFRIGTRLIP